MPARLLAILIIALPLAALDVSAQGRGRGQRQDPAMEIRFRNMDRNNDGIITRDEWRGSAQSFRVHDWNQDGMLSGNEIRIGGRRDQTDERDFDPTTPDEFFDWTEAGFTRLDRNRDGRVVRTEWPFNTESFYRADRNRDNVLSRAEFLGQDVDDDREDRFEYMDVDNNGRIDRDEWHGTDETFKWLDRNNNGSLSRVEVVGQQGRGGAAADQFATLDLNRDNQISVNEWQWSRRSFDQRDANGDGLITRREFAATNVTPDVPAPVPARALRISSQTQWTDTGITLRAGDVVTLQATGTIAMSNDPSDTAGPGGSHRGRTANSAPLPSAPAGALIGRVGNSGVRLVGDRLTITSPLSGRLYLGINDDHMADNTGEYRVTVSVQGQTTRY
jgi:Ca2+-binding EF-hand superfamily protein